jgi:hypothetical protein
MGGTKQNRILIGDLRISIVCITHKTECKHYNSGDINPWVIAGCDIETQPPHGENNAEYGTLKSLLYVRL